METLLAISFVLLVPAAYAWHMLWVSWQQRRALSAGRKLIPAGNGPVPPEIHPDDIRYSLYSVGLFMLAGMAVYGLHHLGRAFYWDWNRYGWLWLIASPVALVLLHDTWFYWTHRLLHARWWFTHVHHVHHRSHHPSVWTALAFHPLEALLQAAFVPLVVWLLPLHPAALTVFLWYMAGKNVRGHSGLERAPYALSHPWFAWRNTATDHQRHHEEGRCNYGLYTTLWDRLMHTLRRA